MLSRDDSRPLRVYFASHMVSGSVLEANRDFVRLLMATPRAEIVINAAQIIAVAFDVENVPWLQERR